MYEERQFDTSSVYLSNGTLNPEKSGHFNGKPTAELAAAWKSLMQHQNIAVPKESLGQSAHDDGLIELADGSGYAASLAVFHGLHCVKRFHHWVHRDAYYPDLNDHDKDKLLFHTEHCVDWLRQYVQCNADTTVIPFYWGSEQPIPLAIDKNKHQCMVWEPLEEWAAERSFDIFTHGLLVHPVLGNPYDGDGKGDAIGIALDDHVLPGNH
ncbi:hypothetical protein BDV96DRAFT_606088 [Lophiotrema nucula]|uniref:Tat pathway signal sequence n=1 Tax=Lophiotrema nucula TaxID=690887 RepID=A0A6A5YNP7_9PLEO|nr:hypothetical protein BDV96DRAFT_606088 [Lophiotrema nucula]